MSYNLDQSPLYKLKTKQRLADTLGVELVELIILASKGTENFRQFTKVIPEKKPRPIEHPKPKLRYIQIRIADLLTRISTPEYLHSGIKHRSYISNATVHRCDVNIVKLDIAQFFRNARRDRVYLFFLRTMQCSPDVSALLADVTTINLHLPTGGNTSPILSFYAYKEMFDRIYELACRKDLRMTLLIDDLTFSGENATPFFLNEVRMMIRQFGLQTSRRKCKALKVNQVKIITGVALTSEGFKLPNKRRLAIHNSYIKLADSVHKHEQIAALKQLIGRLFEASQIEPHLGHQGRSLMRLQREFRMRGILTSRVG